MSEKKVLIVVPAFNEGAVIARLVKEIKSLYPHYHMLIVDDGSSDKTTQEAEAAGATVIHHPYNLGIGGAVQTGFKIAKEDNYDAVIQVDGDAQHDPKYIQTVLKPVLENELDLAIGSRFLKSESDFRSTFLRRIGIRFFALLLGTITGIHVTDPTSGYRATSKKLIPRFAAYYPIDFPEPEAIQIAKRYGARIGEIPVSMRERTGGISSIRYLKTFYYMVKVTLAILIDTLKKDPYAG